MINKKEMALKISSKLEFLMKTKNIKGSDIANTIPMTVENFSYFKNRLKKGELPSAKFLVGISIFFKEDFFC